MKIPTMFLAAALVFASSDLHAAMKSEKEKCLASIAVIAEMKADDETPDIGEKASLELEQLIEIANHLCEQGNFKYASDIVAIARGMLVSE